MKEKYSGKSERKRMIRVKWESSEMMFYKKASILFTQRFATFHHREPWWCMKVFLSPLLPWKYSVIYSLWLYLKFLRFVDLPFFFFCFSPLIPIWGIRNPGPKHASLPHHQSSSNCILFQNMAVGLLCLNHYTSLLRPNACFFF